jgi:internalin A
MQASDKRSRGTGFGGRRLLRFSLRTLFLLTTLIAVWLGFLCKRAQEQQLAVDRIAELGGFVGYDFQYGRDGARIKNATPVGWTWLRTMTGDHFFQRVVQVHLDERAVTDADLKLIGRLRHTTTLALNDTNISDDGLAMISGLGRLQYLGLARTRVSDAGLRHVEGLRDLEMLILEHAGVGDEGVRALTRLQQLEILVLSGTRVTSDSISSLSGLSNLQELMLRNTAVDDAAIPLLVKFGKLQQLHLDGARLSGEGLSDLVHTLKATAPSLMVTCDNFDLSGAGEIEFGSPRWEKLAKRIQDLDAENRIKLLDLSDSPATDAHLPPLMGLKNVQMIDLRGLQVTDAGLEQLKAALPHCKIYP